MNDYEGEIDSQVSQAENEVVKLKTCASRPLSFQNLKELRFFILYFPIF